MEEILSVQGDQIQNSEDPADRGQKRLHAAGGARSRAAETWPGPRFHGHTGAAAPVLWARGCPPGPLSPSAYKYPLGVLQGDPEEFLGSF